MRRTGRLRDSEEGITLIELAIAAALSMVVLSLLAGAMIVTYRVGNFTQGQSFSLDGARLALQQVSRDFQGALGIEACPSASFGNCAVLLAQSPTGSLEQVRYERVGSELRRSIWDTDAEEYGLPRVLSDRVANPDDLGLFSCETQATFLRVRIDLVVQPIPDHSPTYHLSTSARPRNFLAGTASCP